MEKIIVTSFEDFDVQLKKIRSQVMQQNPEFNKLKKEPHFLYRGQSNAEWGLKTTLDRVLNEQPIEVSEYHRKALCAKSVISSYTGQKWSVPDYQEFIKATTKDGGCLMPFDGYIETLQYYTHLRHYGFPSPLLDWTISPYIALFFACHQTTGFKQDDPDMSVFVYLERIFSKGGSVGEASIETIGGNLETNKRHHVQQAEYSICIRKVYSDNKGNGHFEYKQHQQIFDSDNREQDILWKIIVPAKEKKDILTKLDKFNINAYTLFDSEDGLVQMLSFRYFF